MNFKTKLLRSCAFAIALASAMLASADVVFDNMSKFEAGDPSADVTFTPSTPNTFMGDGYGLTPGTVNITGFDIYPVNESGTSYAGLRVTIYVWGTVNTGAVSAGNPAFGNLLATYTLTTSGTFDSGFYYPFEGVPSGSAPGVTLATPLAISGTNVGISINYQGTTDGVNYNDANDLTSLVSYGTPPTFGSQMFDGYYRNVASESDGNFTTSSRSLGLTFQSLALRIYGTPGVVGNLPPVATAQNISVPKNSSVNLTLTAVDPNGDPLTYSVVASPTNGLLSGIAPNLTYTPNTNYIGPDAFSFTANDGQTDSAPALVSIAVLAGSAGLVINPVWDATILSDPQVVAITNTIRIAIQSLESRFSNPVTVTILFAEMNSGLGQSLTYISTKNYSSYYDALVTGAKTTNDTAALTTITGGGFNPVNGGGDITGTLSMWRALGFHDDPPSGQPDSTVSLNMSLINITRPGVNPNNYDLQAVASHEMDEVLGTISGVGQANICPVDLFRYTAGGARSYTTAGDDAYFSIDGGATDLVRYNQNPGGDFGDFWSIGAHSPVRVQDAFGSPGTAPDLGVELTILDVIGWDLITAVSVPAPVFQSVTQVGDKINLYWSSVAGRSYQIEYTTNLTAPTWLALGAPITATNVTTSSADIIGPDLQRFYHVALLTAPITSPSFVSRPTVDSSGAKTLKLRKHITTAWPHAAPTKSSIAIVQHRRFPVAPAVERETIDERSSVVP